MPHRVLPVPHSGSAARLNEERNCEKYVTVASFLVVAVGIAVLIGWQFGIEFLKNPLSIARSTFMAPNTALCFILLGASLWLQQRRTGILWGGLGKALAIFVLAFAALTVVEYAARIDFGIDRIFFHHTMSDWTVSSPPGRFALVTSIGFCLLAFALLSLEKPRQRISEFLSLAVAGLAFVNILGYLYGARFLYAISGVNHIALHTGYTFLVLSVGVMFVTCDRGIPALLLSPELEGSVARRLLALILFLLPCLGWVRVRAESHGGVDDALATAILVFATIAVFIGFLINFTGLVRTENQKREAAERELRRAHQQLSTVVNSISDGLCVLDREWRFTYFSETAAKFVGMRSENIIGRAIREVFPAIRGTKFEELYQLAMTTGEVQHFEALYPEPLDRWFECHCYPSEEGLTIYFHDVTQSRQAEEALRASQERVTLAIEATGYGTFDWDVQAGRATCSAETKSHFGLSPDAWVDYYVFLSALHRDDRARVHGIVQHVLQPENGGYYQTEYRTVGLEDGKQRWISAMGRVFFNEAGQPIRFIGATVDITERKQREEALQESEERFRSMYQNTAVGVEQDALDGRLLMVNPALCRMLGRSEEELCSMSFEQITHPEDLPREAELLNAMFRNERDSYEIEKRYLHCDGSAVWVSVTSSMVRGAGNTPLYRISMIQDISERKNAEAVLIRAEKLATAGRLAGSIAHEINNPLEAITNLLYLARHTQGVPAEAGSLLESADEELKRLAHLAKQTLGFYRESAGASTFNVAQQVNELLVIYGAKFRSRRVELKLDLEAQAEVFGNTGEFRQVISNLLVNAADAIPESGGQILIRARSNSNTMGRGPSVRVTVADNGSGIAAEHLQRIFEPFFTTKQHVGTGLGLWLSRDIVLKSGGRMRVRSRTARGCSGTVFTIFWPSRPGRRADDRQPGDGTTAMRYPYCA